MSSTGFQRDLSNQGRTSAAATPGRSAAGAGREPNSAAIPHEQIAKKAYEIWMSHGRPQGQATQHWQQAEQELRRTSKGTRA